MAALTFAKLAVRVIPFDRLGSLTGLPAPAGDAALPPRSRDPIAASIGYAVRRGSRRLPWYSSCLVRVIAGRLMLRRRGVPSTLVFGVAKRNNELLAHAWLVANGGIVCGGREARDFRPIAAFSEAGPGPRSPEGPPPRSDRSTR